MQYFGHIWAGTAQSTLSDLDRVQKRLRGLLSFEQHLSHRRNIAILSRLYRYFLRETSCCVKSHLLLLREVGHYDMSVNRLFPLTTCPCDFNFQRLNMRSSNGPASGVSHCAIWDVVYAEDVCFHSISFLMLVFFDVMHLLMSKACRKIGKTDARNNLVFDSRQMFPSSQIATAAIV